MIDTQDCSICKKKKRLDKTTFKDTPNGSMCEDCYNNYAVEIFGEYMEEQINSIFPDNIIKTVAEDMGFFSNTHTKVYEKALKYIIHMAMYKPDIEIEKDELAAYLKGTRVDIDKIIDALKGAEFLIDTRKGGLYRPGENAIEFGNIMKTQHRPERDVIKLAYGRLNILLMNKSNNHVGWMKTILALAEDIINAKKDSGSIAEFDIHINSLFRHAKNAGIKPSSMIDQLERMLGHTPDSDGNPVIFSDMEYRNGYPWSSDNPTWDFQLTMKPQWISIRERINSRMRGR